MLKTRALILAKIETGYGTDPTPTAAANAILCESPEFEVIGAKLDRKNVKSYFGTLPSVNVGTGLKATFTTELKGSGAAGTVPEIGVLLRACNFAETISAGVSVTYAPHSKALSTDSPAPESITIYFYQHNVLHHMHGCKGTFGIEAKATEYAKIKWEFTGIYEGPVDGAIAAGTFNATLPPVFKAASFALDTYVAIIENLKIDVKNEIAKRVSANAATGILEYFIKERAVAGEIDPEMVPIATKDFWLLWSGSSRVAMTAAIGATAGNICTITAPKVELDIPKYGAREDILTFNPPLIFTPNAGNDEISIAFT